MKRYERIITALAGGIPDRPPISFDSHSKAMDPVYAHYGVRDKNGLYEAAGIDGFSVWEWNAVMGDYIGPEMRAPDGARLDFWGNMGQHHHGLAARDTIAGLKAHRWPRLEDFDFSGIHARALAIKKQDMPAAAGHLGVGYQMHNMLRGNEKALSDVTDEAWMECYLELVTNFTVAYIDSLLKAGKGEIDVVRADDDMGTMDRMMIGPGMWRRYYKPCWKSVFDIVHAHGAKLWFHSCGHIMPLMEDLIEIGVDCWNPFPEYVKGNDHVRLKEFRRGRLVLDGGVNHMLLVKGSPKDVFKETRRVIDLFAPDGGLLIGPSQVFTEDIPPANIIALFEAALQ